MKLLLTVVAFLFVSAVYSQDKPVQKVEVVTKGIVTKTDEVKVARVYRRKNSRIKKELSFVGKYRTVMV